MSHNTASRKLGYFSATAIIIAVMIGTGVFTLTGFIAQNISSQTLIIAAWGLGGVISLCGALSYAELASYMPESGGEYYFLSRLMHPSIGFLSGWVSFIAGFSAPVAASAVALGTYSSAFWNSINPISVALISVIILSIMHIIDTKFGSYIQNMLTLIKILLIFFFISIGYFGASEKNVFMNNHENHFDAFFHEDFLASMLLISYAYAGWNMAAYIGGEIKNPKKNLPLSLITGTLFVAFIYILINIIYLKILTINDIKGVLEIGYLSMKTLYGDSIGRWFSLGISIALISMISALLMAGPRIYMMVGNDYKIFKLLSIKTSRDTPIISIILQASVAIILIITMSYESLLYYIGFTLTIFSVLAVSCVFLLRANGHNSNFKTPLYPLVPLVFICSNLLILFYTIQKKPIESTIGFVTIVTGFIIYIFAKSYEQSSKTTYPQKVAKSSYSNTTKSSK
ncbi:amino acid permease [Prosthecochloris sp.]|uniref:APC family permease n=1 Tax=Prosthecochloris sp. TaxID=290513 RepID=UPI00257D3B3D|nr:amino acid permease [Prosthecochloris sp.]